MLLIGFTGVHVSSIGFKTIHVTDGRKLTIWVRADYEVVPTVVGVRTRDLYARLLPPFKVRLAATCTGRGDGYFDVYDGYIGSDRVRRGVRVYCDWMDCQTLTADRMYTVTGLCPQQGLLIAESVAEVPATGQ